MAREDHQDLVGTSYAGFTAATTILSSPPNDIINSPSHYARGIEVWDVIEHFNLNYNMGNVAKYILRAGVKTPDPLEDYRKARAYINREISIREGKTAFARALAS